MPNGGRTMPSDKQPSQPSELTSIGFRLPAGLLARIDALKDSRPGWRTRTDIMIALLEVGLSAGAVETQDAGENVWDAIAALGERLAAVEDELRSHPTQPAPKESRLTEEERDAIAAAKSAAPPAPTATAQPAPAQTTKPPAPPLKSLTDRPMRNHWEKVGRPGESLAAWLESFGFTSEGKGNKRKWYPPGG